MGWHACHFTHPFLRAPEQHDVDRTRKIGEEASSQPPEGAALPRGTDGQQHEPKEDPSQAQPRGRHRLDAVHPTPHLVPGGANEEEGRGGQDLTKMRVFMIPSWVVGESCAKRWSGRAGLIAVDRRWFHATVCATHTLDAGVHTCVPLYG
jgi:hypothetical protein